MNPRVLILEPGNQLLAIDNARPNGALGPAFLVAALRAQGIEADYFDATVGRSIADLQETFYKRVEQENGAIRYGMSPDDLAEVLAHYDVIATSSIFTAQTRMHFEVAQVARKTASARGRRILVVAGGVNARAMRRQFLGNGFDIIALGDGEQTLVDIVQAFSQPVPDFSEIAGIAYLQDGRLIEQRAKPGSPRNLDHLPFPAWEAFPLDVYEHLGAPQARVLMAGGTKFAGIQTSRGCQDTCTFCHISVEKQETDLLGRIGFLRDFSPARVGAEVDRAYAMGIRRLYFEDDNLFYNKRRLETLAPYLKREGLEYSNVNGANLRFLFRKSGNRYEVDTEFIEVLSDFGLRELTMPFETHSQEMMDKYASGKFQRDDMNPFALVHALKDAGIAIAGNFMIGFRDEEWDSILRTKEYARQVVEAGVDAVAFMIPVPYPGTVDFQVAMQDKAAQEDFARDPLKYTDRMHWRAKPLFPTRVAGERLAAAVHDFWHEINDTTFTDTKSAANVLRRDVPR